MKIQVLEFFKWKYSIFDRSKLWLDRSKWKNLEAFGCLDAAWFLFDRLKRALDWSKVIFDQSKIVKQDFFVELSDDYWERLKRFWALWTVLWNILILHTCLLLKYNPMGINRGLCSLETQEILWSFSRIVICKTQHLCCILETNLW